ncbi:Serine/threonine-protein kinase PK-1 [Curvibacter sp. AEP1-3]|uniref:serine/threonine protein kinase n=1 Tax=Curvibacter sp. AEP1-3 TaxID=1844971 RepID=UPI000B3D04E1|nr:serine/threonine-protein kinase [Curvibacter sp. AEP1-3]ARV18799.1 Serine/threonine-protein kinase PK-1 [Curvibacter sp. AEP1-3]
MADITTPTSKPKAPATGHLDALAPGTRLAEFEVQGLLGVGGFGMVYRGYDHSLHRAVAIKEYMPTSLVGRDRNHSVTVKSAVDAASFESGLRSFIAEARLLARFDHPSLVKVYRFWEANNTAYMAMPLYEGITLKEARRRMSGPPPQAWLQSVLWSVLAGLKVLHDNSTLHRDISPDNIFLQNVGPPVLLDLGAARRAILDTSHKHTAVLKVNYAPIEQYADAKDMQEGPWTDLYAVAAVMHGCICNEPPLPATFRAVRDRMPSFEQVTQTAQTHFNQTYSDNFVQAISHALAIEPTERTASVEAFAREIGLKSPPDLARFDWRKALGDSVTLTETGEDPEPITTELLTTQPASDFPDTVFQPTTYDHSKTVKTLSRADVAAKPRVARSSATVSKGIPLWFWLVPTALLLALIAWWMRPVTIPAAVVPPTQADAPSAVITEPAEVPSTPPESPAHPKQTAPIATSGGKTPGADAVAGSQRAVVPAKPVAQAPVAATEKVAPPKPQPRSDAKPLDDKPTPARDPIAICAEASILTRTMCIYRECQKPEFYQLPVCVADRKHWEEKNKARN